MEQSIKYFGVPKPSSNIEDEKLLRDFILGLLILPEYNTHMVYRTMRIFKIQNQEKRTQLIQRVQKRVNDYLPQLEDSIDEQIQFKTAFLNKLPCWIPTFSHLSRTELEEIAFKTYVPFKVLVFIQFLAFLKITDLKSEKTIAFLKEYAELFSQNQIDRVLDCYNESENKIQELMNQ